MDYSDYNLCQELARKKNESISVYIRKLMRNAIERQERLERRQKKEDDLLTQEHLNQIQRIQKLSQRLESVNIDNLTEYMNLLADYTEDEIAQAMFEKHGIDIEL